MSRLHFVRHGPTHARTMVGWLDLPADLSDTPALARLAAHLPADAVVVSSDLSRARATADAIGQERARLPDDPDLREINFGTWDGRTHDDITAEDPALSRAFWERPGDIAPPGGESWNALAARVSRAVDRLRAAHPGRDIVAVAHIGVILTQVQRATGQSAYEVLAHSIDNLSVTDMVWTGAGWRIGQINHRP